MLLLVKNLFFSLKKTLMNSCLIRRSGAAVFSYKRSVWRHQQESDSTPEEPAPKRRRGLDPAETGNILYLTVSLSLVQAVGHLENLVFSR